MESYAWYLEPYGSGWEEGTSAFGHQQQTQTAGTMLGNGLQASCVLKWTPELHASFVAAVDACGGAFAAKPSKVRNFMQQLGEPALTMKQIKSHLQKYRIRVAKEQGLATAGVSCGQPPAAATIDTSAAAIDTAAAAATAAATQQQLALQQRQLALQQQQLSLQQRKLQAHQLALSQQQRSRKRSRSASDLQLAEEEAMQAQAIQQQHGEVVFVDSPRGPCPYPSSGSPQPSDTLQLAELLPACGSMEAPTSQQQQQQQCQPAPEQQQQQYTAQAATSLAVPQQHQQQQLSSQPQAVPAEELANALERATALEHALVAEVTQVQRLQQELEALRAELARLRTLVPSEQQASEFCGEGSAAAGTEEGSDPYALDSSGDQADPYSVGGSGDPYTWLLMNALEMPSPEAASYPTGSGGTSNISSS